MKKFYKIEFIAELTEDDVRAMNKCFFDAMNESMNIYDLSNFKMTPVEGDKPSELEQFLAKPLTHILDVKLAFTLCKSESDVEDTIKALPAGFGTFSVEYDADNGGFTVFNSYYDENTDDYIDDEFWIDFNEGWNYEEEEN